MDKSQKKAPPNIVKSNIALKLAEKWVNNMAEAKDDEQTEPLGRPSRLGLGAKVPRKTTVGPLEDPLERKLYAKLGGRNRNSAANDSTLAAPKKDGFDDDDSDDSEDSESRTRVFDKKRSANPAAPPVHAKKRK